MKTCNRPGCQSEFVPKKGNQAYCSPECRYAVCMTRNKLRGREERRAARIEKRMDQTLQRERGSKRKLSQACDRGQKNLFQAYMAANPYYFQDIFDMQASPENITAAMRMVL